MPLTRAILLFLVCLADVTVRYCLTADRAWQLDYSAFAHADTVIGLTQHTYWNLNAAQALITEHVLQMQVCCVCACCVCCFI